MRSLTLISLLALALILSLSHQCNSFKLSNINTRSSSSSSHKTIQSIDSKQLISSVLGILLSFNIIDVKPAAALLAPLANVGVKEFLVKDGKQWLRLSQPVGNDIKLGSLRSSSPEIEIQENLELPRLRLEQVGFSNNPAWQKGLSDVSAAKVTIESNRNTLIDNALDKDKAKASYDNVIEKVQDLMSVLKDKDAGKVFELQDAAAQSFSDLRALQLPVKKLPYNIPEEFQSLPILAGRAKVEVIVDSKDGFSEESGKKHKTETFLLEVDGYHAPITAGNFIDLVQQKYYDDCKTDNVQELIVQFGKAAKKPSSRTIPLEIFYRSDTEPTYSTTSDDDMRATEAFALPFQGYGALGMGRGVEDTDSASSEVFVLKWRQALMPPGRNTLDGFYSSFGYVISNNEQYWGQVTANDVIRSIKVVEGIDNFIKKS